MCRHASRPLGRARHAMFPLQLGSRLLLDNERHPTTHPFRLTMPHEAFALTAAGAVLGPLCDSLHSSHDVLHYNRPSYVDIPAVGIHIETCWWVPALFGLAGLLIGVGYPLLDELLSSPSSKTTNGALYQDQAPGPSLPLAPGWPQVLLCISLFVLQYDLSAELDSAAAAAAGAVGAVAANGVTSLTTASAAAHLSHWTNLVLAAYGLAVWGVFDRTKAGLLMSALTALGGPLIEVALINQLGLYQYLHPDVLGVPSWIPWVYFCGGPAVGLLGRQVWAELAQQDAAEQLGRET